MSLNDVLKGMGIEEALSDDADFSNMTGGKSLKIDAVIHKAVIEVDEKGTKAAAATKVRARAKGRARPVPVIRFDHPFQFMIYDEQNAVCLFSGLFVGK